jgi:putative transcriptional regulator
MKKTKPYRLMASIHETAEGLHAAGLMNKVTMRKFDDMCRMNAEAKLITRTHP